MSDERVTVKWRDAHDRRRRHTARGVIVQDEGWHSITLERTIIPNDVPGRPREPEHKVRVTIRRDDIISIT